jgi:hypothetical protein
MTRFVPGATDELPPGSYTNYEAAISNPVSAPTEGVVAVPFTSDWGPEGEVISLPNVGKYRAVFGLSTDTAGYRAAVQTFKGEGVDNKGGAAVMLGLRMVGSSGKQAQAKLKDTKAEPVADALVLKGKYKGAKGNDLGWKVIVNSKDAAKNDLIIYDGTQEIERYTHDKNELLKLAESINNRSNWVTADASKATVGKSLATTGAIASFTEGDSGNTLTAEDWTTAMDEMGKQRFGTFVPFDLTDESIFASLKEWGQNINLTKNKRFGVLTGGELAETIDEAIERAEIFNDENFATVGVGVYKDIDLLDEDGEETELSSSQLAPRIAGIIAAAGESEAITFSRLRGVTVVSGPTDDEIVAGLSGGVITIGIDSNAVAPTRVVRGITTYTDDTTDKPFKFYSVLKFVRTMQGFENDLQDLWTDKKIGKLPVDEATRELVIGEAKRLMKERVDDRVIQDTLLDGSKGWFVKISDNPAPSDDDDFIALDYGMAFERTLDKMLNRVVIS